jgi:molybdopterin synthase sulfur carrier subunit
VIRVRLFASLRERLDCAQRELPWTEATASVAGVKRSLGSLGADWQQALAEPAIISAVNQEVVDDDNPVADGDEVAFFPPVTGG